MHKNKTLLLVTARKRLSVFIILALVIGVLGNTFAAEENVPTLKISSVTGKPGERVTVEISVDNPQGIAGMQFSVNYDPSILAVSDADVKANTISGWIFDTNVIQEEGKVYFAGASANAITVSSEMTVCSIAFTISKSADIGNTEVTIADLYVANDVPQKIEMNIQNGKITVSGESSDPGNNDPGNNDPGNNYPGNNVPGSKEQSSTETVDENASTDINAQTIVDNLGNVTVSVTQDQINNAISAAELSALPTGIKIKADCVKDAMKVTINIPAQSFRKLAENDRISFVLIQTCTATITLDKKALASISNNVTSTSNNISIIIEKVSNSAFLSEIKNQVGNRPAYNFFVYVDDRDVPNLSQGNVIISLPYTLASEDDPNAVIIYCIDRNGNASIVPNCVYDTEENAVVFTTSRFLMYAIGYNKRVFSDVSGWATDYITYLAAREIISGIGDGKFAPNVNIKRCEFVKMLAGIAGADVSVYSGSKFKDVKSSDWFAPYVAWAAEMEIVFGVGNGMFAPYDDISRQDMAVMIDRFAIYVNYSLPEVTAEVTFSDNDSIKSYALEAVKRLQRAGIISGMSDGTFAPTKGATRAESAKMLAVFLQGMAKTIK
ncbi:MAG TPA: hypothetical protein GXX14_08730 [Clostridiaceae bacterium]|nr:hypothetical protein [Clostridiaceae bacterium]